MNFAASFPVCVHLFFFLDIFLSCFCSTKAPPPRTLCTAAKDHHLLLLLPSFSSHMHPYAHPHKQAKHSNILTVPYSLIVRLCFASFLSVFFFVCFSFPTLVFLLLFCLSAVRFFCRWLKCLRYYIGFSSGTAMFLVYSLFFSALHSSTHLMARTPRFDASSWHHPKLSYSPLPKCTITQSA